MRRILDALKDFSKKDDKILLVLCWIVAGFGLVVIASATQAPKYGGNIRYVAIQFVAIALGTLMYIVFSSIDIELISEYRIVLVGINCFLLLMLLSPLGTDNDSGNRSWVDLGIINVQPAEICKITYVLIMASVMSSHQNRISHPVSVAHMLLHLGLLIGLNLVISSDGCVLDFCIYLHWHDLHRRCQPMVVCCCNWRNWCHDAYTMAVPWDLSKKQNSHSV